MFGFGKNKKEDSKIIIPKREPIKTPVGLRVVGNELSNDEAGQILNDKECKKHSGCDCLKKAITMMLITSSQLMMVARTNKAKAESAEKRFNKAMNAGVRHLEILDDARTIVRVYSEGKKVDHTLVSKLKKRMDEALKPPTKEEKKARESAAATPGNA